MQDDAFDLAIKNIFLVTFTARVIALHLLQSEFKNISPSKWRDLQLNSLTSDSFPDFLRPIQLYLLANHKVLRDIMGELLAFHKRLYGERMVL